MIGTLLCGRYRLEDRLGSGGMSTVYRAFDETLERWVAIKLLHREISGEDDQLERFRREARAVARLSSPYVVTVIDAGEDEGRPFIVFELVEGETLKDRIRRLGRLPIGEAVAYAIEIGRALEAAHAERLVHRDVKPQNVLLNEDGRAKVTDFGIARSLEAEGLTVTGRVLGTTDYVSPEQALGEPVTEQSDVYSLGIVLYEMLAGSPPFTADTQVGVAMKHVQEPMPDIQVVRPEVSNALAAVVERATAKERRNRYPDISALVADLEHTLAIEAARAGEATGEATSVLQALPSSETSDFVPLRVRAPRRWLAVVGLAAAALGVVGVLVVMNAEKGSTGNAAPERSGGRQAVTLQAANDYDPQSDDRDENGGQTRNAVDDNRATTWRTERYNSPEFGNLKDGVGIYVNADAAVAARRFDLITPTPGFAAEVYAANDVPDGIEGWTRVGEAPAVGQAARIRLDTGGRRFRRYLLWITRLPHDNRAEIAEISLR